ncbi:hypothetical protein E1A91_D07G250300v1 [Gossypium mustelinum]|uniref:Uncharacterized protein n=2 Tax=Gossypium TaxID=3633 RepID=A0A5J5QWL8_GOSBA|nr:hypothetical protein ES319_D07G244200v1 [Gossypium barbadense]TYI75083.1 hypothetical protein E1A91_D07G250300v1 [Gossypium mustelinum]
MISESLVAENSEKKPDIRNIEEAELSLRESSSLNYKEARALLGRIEYQKGNIEAALHVFVERSKRRSHDDAPPQMSIHTVSLLLEAIFLKAKSLQHLQRFREAAQTCKVILDIVESSIPQGLPENFSADCKLQETLNEAVEMLPELWKCSDSPHEAILSYRQALLHQWNLDAETIARIQKQFAIFLLYYGGEALPPNLCSQMDSSFIPRNNIEEAILLIEWDPSILDHLSFALSLSGDLRALANQIEELLPGFICRKERYHSFIIEDPHCVPVLLMASRICGEQPNLVEEGINFAHRSLESLDNECSELEGIANLLLGVAHSTHSKWSKALQTLEKARNITSMKDPNILYHLSLENVEQRKLEGALYYAKSLLKLEGGFNIKGWLLLGRVLSAQKRFVDSETILNASLDQTGKWDQRELLHTKVKIQLAQGQLRNAFDTYTELLGILHVQNKSFGSGKKLHKDCGCYSRSFEQEIWHDLAYLYISLSRWKDAEICLSKSNAISSFSAVRNHATGLLYERKGLLKEALKAFQSALGIDLDHAPSLISAAGVLRQLKCQPDAVVKSFLMNTLRVDRMNPSAWYNLGLLLKAEGTPLSLEEAAECFQAAAILGELGTRLLIHSD